MANTKATRVAVYARVSTHDQDAEVQLRELRTYVKRRGWTLAGEFVDEGVSGAKDRRPALDRMMVAVRQRRIDVVTVWALDRLGRSLRHLVVTMDEFASLGVDLTCYSQPIDTTSPAGRLTFAVLGAVAEFEREMIRERVRAGLAKAKDSGKRLGRPAKPLDLDRARELLAGGTSFRGAARALSVHPNTLRRALAARSA